jgi:CRISPR-associated endonuclease Cas3-HD
VTAYAHSLPGRPREEWQPLEEHLRNVAEKAAEFAGAFASQDWAWNAGWLHDVGKIAPEFQAYLARENNLDDSEYDVAGVGRVNHSSAGAALAEDLFGKAGVPLGLPLAYLAAGRKNTVPYGLYISHGFVSAHLANQTTFSEDDLELLWKALSDMFEHDRSAARGLMSTQKLVVFKHGSALGEKSAQSQFARLAVEPIKAPPRSIADYRITLDGKELPKDQVRIDVAVA